MSHPEACNRILRGLTYVCLGWGMGTVVRVTAFLIRLGRRDPLDKGHQRSQRDVERALKADKASFRSWFFFFLTLILDKSCNSSEPRVPNL